MKKKIYVVKIGRETGIYDEYKNKRNYADLVY